VEPQEILKTEREVKMSHIKTLVVGNLQKENVDNKTIGCGECQTSCQSACKTSCTIANQACEQKA